MDARPEERLLPLFWALHGYKKHQEDFPRPLLTVRGKPLANALPACVEVAVVGSIADAHAHRLAVAAALFSSSASARFCWITYGNK
jgi:hypothetical protein